MTIALLALSLGTRVETAAALVFVSALNPFVHIGEVGQIDAFYGLSVTPTHHQLTINGRKLWAWCAPDTLEHPELLGSTAAIESRDPQTGHLVRLTVSPAQIEAVEPESAAVSMRRPETWDATSSIRIMTSACHFGFFFASRESGERWLANHP
jgi:alkylmercury lyase